MLAVNGQDLKAELRAIGWSQKDLAKRLEVNEDTVGRWVTGKTVVPGYVVEYLRVLGLARQILEGK